MKQVGVRGLAAAIDENIALGRYLADRVQAAPDLELMAPPSLSVVCFRVANRDDAFTAPCSNACSWAATRFSRNRVRRPFRAARLHPELPKPARGRRSHAGRVRAIAHDAAV